MRPRVAAIPAAITPTVAAPTATTLAVLDVFAFGLARALLAGFASLELEAVDFLAEALARRGAAAFFLVADLAAGARLAARLGLSAVAGCVGVASAGGDFGLADLDGDLRETVLLVVLVPVEGGLLLAIIFSITTGVSTVRDGHGSETTRIDLDR